MGDGRSKTIFPLKTNPDLYIPTPVKYGRYDGKTGREPDSVIFKGKPISTTNEKVSSRAFNMATDRGIK